MKKTILLVSVVLLTINSYAQFPTTAQNWTIPVMESSGTNLDQVNNTNYSLVDINGDGKPDLVDAQDQSTGSVWMGSGAYWKVYLNTGGSFSSTAQNWTIPVMESSGTNLDQVSNTNYSLVDINGDGKPDLVDAQDQSTGSVWMGSGAYWKVYLNNGSSFSSTAQNWTIPVMETSGTNLDQVYNTNYSLVDINGDGFPDLVDAQDQSTNAVWLGSGAYWKVYLNNGSSFSSTAQNWTIPTMELSSANLDQVNNTNYSLVDINGDGKPDLVDAQDQNTNAVWLGSGAYWKVYLNSGTSFSSTAQNWTIPTMESSSANLDQVNNTNYSLVDINGDGKPDLVDAQDQSTNAVWLGSGAYWKVYVNNGSSFSTTAQNWTIPTMESSSANLDQVNNTNYSLVDINGDGYPDLVDAQDQSTGSVWMGSGAYWKVYGNILEVQEYGINSKNLKIYPNPTNGELNIEMIDIVGESNIRITNTLGSVVFEKTISDVYHFEYNIESFDSGLYFISLKNNNSIYTTRIIKE